MNKEKIHNLLKIENDKTTIFTNQEIKMIVKLKEKTKESDIMNKELIGKFVITIDGHSGVVIKQFKPTGRSITIHIKENDGRIWYCPISDVIKVGDSNE